MRPRWRSLRRDRAFWEAWADPTGSVECWYCGVSVLGPEAAAHVFPHIEHQQPLCRGGTEHPSNLVPACHRCNAAKGRLTLEEYRVVVFERRLAVLHDFFEVVQEFMSDSPGMLMEGFDISTPRQPTPMHFDRWLSLLDSERRSLGPRSLCFAQEGASPLDEEAMARSEAHQQQLNETEPQGTA